MAQTKPLVTIDRCPRCGQLVVEINDWGKAGHLYIRFYFEENGLMHKDAHHSHAEELERGLRWTDLRHQIT